MDQTQEPFVALARFPSSVEAHLAKSRLELEGIPSILSNEFSTGEVELRVASSTVHEAVAILGGARSSQALRAYDPPADAPRCLICRSSFLMPEEGPVLWRLFRTIILALLPLPDEWFDRRRVRCGVCGHRWKQERRKADATPGNSSA